MRHVRIPLILLALFATFTTPALAVFTDEEKIELAKVVGAGVGFARAQEDLAFAIPTLGEAALSQPLNRLFVAQNTIRIAMSAAFSSESNGQMTRDQEVAQLRKSVSNAEEIRIEILGLLEALPSNSNISAARGVLNNIDLATFNASLAYAEPAPESFPRIIGPHGDHEFGQATLEHTTQYIHHTLFDGWQFWTRTDGASLVDAKSFFRFNARAVDLMFRAWGMTNEVVLADDHQKILGDVAAGSGIRPYGFFRELLALEYIFNSGGPTTNWRGRKLKLGATGFIRSYSDAFTRMELGTAIADPAGFAAQWDGRRGAFSNVGPTGWAAEFHFDLSDFWTDLDGYGWAAMGFFHTIPSPPCGPGTHPEDGRCVPDNP